MATLPVVVHEPLTLSCLEHSAAGGKSTFLQLLLQNTSPLPLLIRSPSLTTEVNVERLHGNLPQVRPGRDWSVPADDIVVCMFQVFFPLENFSFLWKVQAGGNSFCLL